MILKYIPPTEKKIDEHSYVVNIGNFQIQRKYNVSGIDHSSLTNVVFHIFQNVEKLCNAEYI